MKYGYYIQYSKGDIILSDYQNPVDVGAYNEEESFEWVSSGVLTSEKMDNCDRTVFTHIDNGVDYWIQNVRYIPHLLVSAAVFLLLYLFFSLVIRDPIPVLDELVFSTVGAIFVWIYMSRNDKKSARAMKKRLELKQRVNEATFNTDNNLDEIEAFLESVSKEKAIDIGDWLSVKDFSHFPLINFRGNENFFKLLNFYLKKYGKGYYEILDKNFSLDLSDKKKKEFSARLVSLSNSRKFDLSLFTLILYYRFSQN